MTQIRNNFFVLTGGPGSGKTTLIEALKARGIACVDEAGRAIIKAQMAISGRALPWIDPRLFGELMLQRDVENYLAADPAQTTIFDRGIIDTAGYPLLMGFELEPHLRTAADQLRYNRKVFIAPPWEAIYTQDTERKQDYAESVRCHDLCERVYADAGYHLIALPLASVAQRVRFVLEAIGESGPRA